MGISGAFHMMVINSLRIVVLLVIERKQNRIITVITHKGGGRKSVFGALRTRSRAGVMSRNEREEEEGLLV